MLIVASLLPGCTFWRNFSTYFNTIYLAQAHLDAYEDQQRSTQTSTNGAVAVLNHRWLDEEYQSRELAMSEGRSLPIQPTFSRTLSATKPVANMHLDSAIILGSKVLANKKETKYIEEALYIVGKAQFYKNDFTGARRKFLELIYRFPETKYGADVRVLLSRSMLANHQLDTASSSLTTALAIATKDGDKSAIADVHRATAEYIYAKNPDSLTAIANELRASEDGLSGDELSRVAFDEGAVDYFNGHWDEAEAAFRKAYDAAKDDWLAGEAHIAHAQALRRMSKFDESRSELDMVATRVKYGGSHAAAKYELAYTNELAARALVKNDLRSEAFRTTYHTPLHNAYYSLDTAYRNSSAVIISRAKYRQAEMYREMGYYDSASKIATTLIGTKDFSTPAANELVNNRMRSLSNFSRWRNELAHVDSVEHQVVLQNKMATGRNEQTEMHMAALKEVLGARWREEVPVTLTKDDSVRLIPIEERIQREHALRPKLLVADTTRFLDSLHYVATNAHYQLGHAFETFGEVPQAREEYRSALRYSFRLADPTKDSIHAQVLYAWAQLEGREKNTAVADSLLNELFAHYGQTVFAEQARKLFASAKQSSAGETAYGGAYTALKQSGLEAAKPSLNDVASTYSHEDVAPRALYAIGLTYEEQSRYDSAVVYYRRVLNEYPYSTYAQALRPRLADASARPMRTDPADPISDEDKQKQEVERAKKAREEELKKQRSLMPGMQQNDQDAPEMNQSVQPVPPPPPMPGSTMQTSRPKKTK